jgi:hypothetical protein
MIIKDINTIKANQEEFKRCNQILDDNWTDSSAEQFKTTYLGPIEAAGTTFVAESFVHGQELRHHLQELEELKFRLSKLKEELYEICHHPSWEGCGIGVVEGYDLNNQALHGQEFFVITDEEMPYLNDDDMMEHLAFMRVTNLNEMTDARFYSLI